VPFDGSVKYRDLLHRANITGNNSFYTSNDYSHRAHKEIIIEMYWNRFTPMEILANLQSAKPHPSIKVQGDEESKSGSTTLQDCLEEFKKPELLDEDNKWYCSNCKTHV
jgi:hypothetical protein